MSTVTREGTVMGSHDVPKMTDAEMAEVRARLTTALHKFMEAGSIDPNGFFCLFHMDPETAAMLRIHTDTPIVMVKTEDNFVNPILLEHAETICERERVPVEIARGGIATFFSFPREWMHIGADITELTYEEGDDTE